MVNTLLATCLACIIAGEASNCDVRTQIATAHVWANRQQQGIVGGWYGYAEPTATSTFIAEWHHLYPRFVGDAVMLVSDADLDAVARYTATMTETWTSSQCENGQRLHAFAREEGKQYEPE